MGWKLTAAAVLGDVLLRAPIAVEAGSAFSVPAGPNWLGKDGKWSTFDLRIGTNNPQLVSLTASTAVSEIWIVESTGCDQTPLCKNGRGGVYDIPLSSSWSSLGPWELWPKNSTLTGNGDFGTETVAFTNAQAQRNITVGGALVAGINDTNYFTGFIGIGTTPGTFAGREMKPLINQLVEDMEAIPSHSYGYTAGAWYIGNQAGVNGTPASLTLGGYDSNRFVPHDVAFALNPLVSVPQVLLRGIVAKAPSGDKAPTANWTSTSSLLMGMNESVVASIDSSTPYLWLPGSICDRFAEALGLVYNSSFGLYLFRDNQQYLNFLDRGGPSFDFVLSSFDNTDNFGKPFNVPGVVNISVSSGAFALSVQYPFGRMEFQDPAVPYFPLMRSPTNRDIIIGRAFMQEAYLMTRYEDNKFSVHQALFPENPRTNTKIVDIQASVGASKFKGAVSGGGGLTTGAIAGIVVAISAAATTLGLALLFCRRQKKRQERQQAMRGDDDTKEKDSSSSVNSDAPSSPIERIFSFIIRRRRTRKPAVHEVDGSTSHPVEADAQHQLYEMPVPPEPVELDSTNEGSFGDDTTEFGSEGSQGLSPYEVARIKLQRQLQGPVPSYSPPAPGAIVATDEKTEQDVSPVAHHRPAAAGDASPLSTATYGNSDSFPNSLPSPMTPHGDWTARFDLPSPMTVAPPAMASLFARATSEPSTAGDAASPSAYQPSSMSRSSSSNGSAAAHSPQSLVPPSAAYQRTPIDPSRVVCLGPLPENAQAPAAGAAPRAVPRLLVPDGRHAAAAAATVSSASPVSSSSSADSPVHDPDAGASTLGSNFTVDEEERQVPSRDSSRPRGDAPRSPNSAERIDAAIELVHVPQLAEKRYSWEEGTR